MALWSQSVKEWSGVHSLWRTEIDRQKSENCQFQLNALPRPAIEMMKNFQFIFFLPLYHSTPAIMMKAHLFNSEKSFIYVHERLNILIIKLNAFMLALCFHWNDFFFVVSSSHSSCSLMSESFSHHHQKMGALFVAGFPLRSNQSYQIISNFNKWKLSPLENIIKSFTDDSSDAMEAISNMKANEVFFTVVEEDGLRLILIEVSEKFIIRTCCLNLSGVVCLFWFAARKTLNESWHKSFIGGRTKVFGIVLMIESNVICWGELHSLFFR